MIPLWLEVHVDAAALERALPWKVQARWDAIAAALDDLARRAERHGARLSFRVRERFAKRDRSGFLRGLVARGHEVGWHAHGNGLRAARDAVVAAGGSATIAAPGFVQAKDWRALAAEAKALGARVLTDRVEAPIVAYQGWLAWEPLPGVVSLDVSVSPFDWGVLRREEPRVSGRRAPGADSPTRAREGAGRVVPGRLDVDALTRRIEARSRQRVPTGAVGFFGATFHDHDVMDGAVRADLERLFARYGARIGRSGDVAQRFLDQRHGARRLSAAGHGGGVAGGEPPRPMSRTRVNFAKMRARAARSLRRVRLRVERRGAPAIETTFSVEGRKIAVRRVGPAVADVVVVVVHGGESGVTQGLEPFGLSEAALAEAGIAAWMFARSEGAAPPGSRETVEEARAVLDAALAEGPPVVILTWSAGLVPGLRAALGAADPRVVALIDGEGPADRFSLVPPGDPEHVLAKRDAWEDGAWYGMEAAALIEAFPGRYLRLQAEDDHVHGRMWWHAVRMVDAARDGGINADGRLLPGRIDAHGDAIVEWIRELGESPVPPPGGGGPTASRDSADARPRRAGPAR